MCVPVIEEAASFRRTDPIGSTFVFENNKPWVIDEFREGHFDYVELASDITETESFNSSSASTAAWTGWCSTTRRRRMVITRHCGCTSAANSRYGWASTAFTAIP